MASGGYFRFVLLRMSLSLRCFLSFLSFLSFFSFFDGSLRHVEHHPGLAVVEVVRHAHLDGRVRLDVHEVPALVGREVARQGRKTLRLERLGELVARARTLTERKRHGLLNS